MRENLLSQTLTQSDSKQRLLVVIEPLRGWLSFDFRELWEYRQLLYFFIWRDLKVRYKQTVLGGLWAVIQPFVTMVVFSVFFGALANVPSDGIPYPIFTYTALLPWQLLAFSLATSSQSLVMDQGLITKVYFPRLIVPLSPVFVGLIDFLIAFTVLVGMMFFYRIYPTWAVLTLPLFLLLAVFTAIGAGVWSAALNVQYRDVRHMIPFLTQLWLFITPVAYPASLIPEQWRMLYALNPMVGVVEGFRWALLGQSRPPDMSILISVPVVILLLASGLLYFNHTEKTFADVV